MTIEKIEIQNKAQWLAERVKDVTSTEISALFGLSPYLSAFELFHQKREAAIVTLQPNERMRWGSRLEAAIAHGAAEDQGWVISPLNVYMRDPTARIGSSFDFEIHSTSDGPGLLEVKNVDGLQYRNTWVDDGAGNIEAPEHIELQIQHQMAVSGYKWCALVALVGGNEQKIVLRNCDQDVGQAIRVKVAEFWLTISNNRPPSADYSVDAEFMIKKLHTHALAELIVQADPHLEDLIRLYHRLNTDAADLEKNKQSHRAKILESIGLASKVLTSFGSLACGEVKGRSGTTITADMVGTTIGASAGHRNFRFTHKKEQ